MRLSYYSTIVQPSASGTDDGMPARVVWSVLDTAGVNHMRVSERPSINVQRPL